MRFAVTSCAFASAIVLLSVAPAARAEPPRDKSNSQFTLRYQDAGGALGEQARARARAGDCKAALGQFDAAIRSSVDPTLRRDRGMCFEKLNDPFPAIDDYRVYITSRPDAADADQIRERMARLEESAGVSQASDNRGSTATGNQEVKTTSYNTLHDETERSNEAYESPLRYGTGVVIGPFGRLRRFVGADAPTSLGHAVGGTLRYSATRAATLYLDAQYNGLGVSGEASSAGGIGAHFGFEFRLHVTKNGSDAVLLGASLGYEGYTNRNTQARTYNGMGLAHLGYRHVFGPSLGIELQGDGGAALAFFDNLPLGATKSAEFRFMLGGTLAIVIGF